MKKWNMPEIHELAINETEKGNDNGNKNGHVDTPEGPMPRGLAKKQYPYLFDKNGNYIGDTPDDDLNGAS